MMDLEERNALMEERRLYDLELQRIFGTTSIRCSEEEYEKVSKEVRDLRDKIDTITHELEDGFLNAYERNTIEIKDIFNKLVNDDVKDLKMAFNELYEIFSLTQYKYVSHQNVEITDEIIEKIINKFERFGIKPADYDKTLDDLENETGSMARQLAIAQGLYDLKNKSKSTFDTGEEKFEKLKMEADFKDMFAQSKITKE
jgi:uncharacterized protein YpuA (DUF1002 family)